MRGSKDEEKDSCRGFGCYRVFARRLGRNRGRCQRKKRSKPSSQNRGSSFDYNPGVPNFSNSKLSMTYGGFFGEYSFANWKLFHPSASVLVGVGGVQFSPRDGSGRDASDPSNNLFFYVTEPQLNGIVNLSSAIRAGVSVSYRWVHAGTNNESFNESHLNGFAGGLFVQAGSF
jgi:hypothetical protein